jgi:hypothetical protein
MGTIGTVKLSTYGRHTKVKIVPEPENRWKEVTDKMNQVERTVDDGFVAGGNPDREDRACIRRSGSRGRFSIPHAFQAWILDAKGWTTTTSLSLHYCVLTEYYCTPNGGGFWRARTVSSLVRPPGETKRGHSSM